jgi:S1-C subfamily serine protease
MRLSLRRYLALLAGSVAPCFGALTAPAAPPADSPSNLRRTVTVQVVERAKDAVVNISTTKMVNRRAGPFGDDPFWHQFGEQLGYGVLELEKRIHRGDAEHAEVGRRGRTNPGCGAASTAFTFGISPPVPLHTLRVLCVSAVKRTRESRHCP